MQWIFACIFSTCAAAINNFELHAYPDLLREIESISIEGTSTESFQKCIWTYLFQSRVETPQQINSVTQMYDLFHQVNYCSGLKTSRQKRDLDLTDVEYIVNYVYHSNTTIGGIAIPSVPEELTGLINNLLAVLAKFDGFFSYIRYGNAAAKALTALLEFLKVDEITAAIQSVEGALTIDSLLNQILNVTISLDNINTTGLDPIFFESVLVIVNGNSSMPDKLHAVNVVLDSPLQSLESLTKAVVNGYLSALASSFKINELTNPQWESYFQALHYKINNLLNFGVESSITIRSVLTIYIDQVQATYGSDNAESIDTNFVEFCDVLLNLLDANTDDSESLQKLHTFILRFPADVTFSYVLILWPQAIMVYPVGAFFVFNQIYLQLKSTWYQLSYFDLAQCLLPNADVYFCQQYGLIAAFQTATEEQKLGFLPDILCDMVYPGGIILYGFIIPLNTDNVCQPASINMYKFNYAESAEVDAYYMTLFVMDSATEIVDAWLGTNYFLIYDEYYMMYCLSRGCRYNPEVIEYSFLGTLQTFLSRPLAQTTRSQASEQCIADIAEYEQFPFSFYDSWGKFLLPGYLQGNFKSWGRSDECLGIKMSLSNQNNETRDVYTDFCLGKFVSSALPVPFEYGLCVPKSCKTSDVNAIFQNLQNEYFKISLAITNARVMSDIFQFGKNYATLSEDVSQLMAKIDENKLNLQNANYFKCHEQVRDSYRFTHPSYDPIWTAAMSIMLTFVIMSTIGTAYDMITHMNDKKKTEALKKESEREANAAENGTTNIAYNSDDGATEKKSIDEETDFSVKKEEVTKPIPAKPKTSSFSFLIFFSIRYNVVKLLNTKRPPAVIKSIDGIRAISMTWIIWAHTLYYAVPAMDNQVKLLQSGTDPLYQHIGSAVLGVDTFFCLGGFLSAFLLTKKFKNNSSPAFMLKLYLHRYLRLTLVYGLIILFYTGLAGKYGQGTMLRYISEPRVEICKKYWWRNLLYVSNLIQVCIDGTCTVRSCIGHSWYLSNDMQFFIFGVPLILLLSRKPAAGLASWILIILANLGVIGWLAIDRKVTTLQSQYVTFSGPVYESYWNLYYQPPWSRVGPYAVGVISAYAFKKFLSSKRKFPVWAYIIGWMVGFAVAIAILYGKIPMEKDVEKYLNSPRDIMLLMFDRYAWSLCIMFVVFACHTGGAGVIASILEWDFWVVISKLSYSMYLLHPIIMETAYGGQYVVPYHFNDFKQVLGFLGFLVMSMMWSFCFYVMIESPLMSFEKMLMG